MEANQLSVEDAQSFFTNYSQQTTPVVTAPPTPPTTVVGQENQLTNPQNPLDRPADSAVDDDEKVKDFLEGTKDKDVPKVTDTPQFDDVAAKLFEDKLIYKFDDDSLPKTYDELKEAISQSSLHNAQDQVSKLFQQKVESLSPALQTVLDYGSQGVTTVSEIQQFMSKVSNYEAITSLDPTKEEHQEQIVRIQLLSSGWDNKSVEDEIELYKTNNKLADKATQFFPNLEGKAKAEIQQSYIQKQREIEEQNSLLENNATNVSYFLENEKEYLPFTIDSKQHKAAAFNLAAQPVAFDENTGEAIFGWQNYMKSLQFGTEKDYKTYMKVINFLANPDYYEKKLGKVVSNVTKQDDYKRIKTTTLTGGGASSTTELDDQPRIPRSGGGNWSVK